MPNSALVMRGGLAGALAPFVIFLGGVGWLALMGAPDERGFWPILLAAIATGLALARDRHRYCDSLLAGMAQPIVMLMIMAWLLAGVLSTLLGASGFVEALIWLARAAGVSGGTYVAAAFVVCCLVATSTGTSFGTIIIGGPLLYPAGAATTAKLRADNAHIKFHDGRRGFTLLDFDHKRCQASFQAASKVSIPDGKISTIGTFNVEAGKPGIV
jgi:Na+/H+ antiporter NhaC